MTDLIALVLLIGSLLAAGMAARVRRRMPPTVRIEHDENGVRYTLQDGRLWTRKL